MAARAVGLDLKAGTQTPAPRRRHPRRRHRDAGTQTPAPRRRHRDAGTQTPAPRRSAVRCYGVGPIELVSAADLARGRLRMCKGIRKNKAISR